MSRRATSAEILALFERVKADARTGRDDPKVLAAIQRAGRIGDLRQLALACQISRDRLDQCLDRLSNNGYLPNKRETRNHADAA